tara:strand:+ start:175 stop:348 length:174 start_codon:yes stop_codon:yes gene_type:complete
MKHKGKREKRDMKKWIFHGKELHPEIEDDLYVQFMANLFAALTTALLIGAYHIFFHM